eukprot:Seg6473.2 transcript_id=Seg6473.2/GoldUCD/mRNA.D3Y31 product="Tetratricopeptide repeat protein 4" protein_id=Seg6473.2/GoldUCD/D3Y31
MAEKMDPERSELSERLKKEFNEHLQNITEKNKDYKYGDVLTSENVDEKIKEIPAFMNEAPTQEEIDASPALAALQALRYEETDPQECALAHKEDGNHLFKHKRYDKAILAYTEGLKQKFEDQDLRVILHTNRAAANFHLGNHRSSLNDAKEALKLNDKHMKAVLRAAMCCFELKLFNECVQWCDNGLQNESENKKLLDLRQQALNEKKVQERDSRRREVIEKKLLEKQKKLAAAIKSSAANIETIEGIMKNSDMDLSIVEKLNQVAENHPQGSKTYLDDANQLHWAVYFLYPEFNQSDFIEDFCENDRFENHLDVMFDESSLPDWDTQKHYSKNSLKIYFECEESKSFVNVTSSQTLKDVLRGKRFVIRRGAPSFIILSTKSKFFDDFSKSMKLES